MTPGTARFARLLRRAAGVTGALCCMQKAYGLDNLPVTVLIDRSGRIATTTSGVVDRRVCETELQTLLAEKAP